MQKLETFKHKPIPPTRKITPDTPFVPRMESVRSVHPMDSTSEKSARQMGYQQKQSTQPVKWEVFTPESRRQLEINPCRDDDVGLANEPGIMNQVG